jgi:hypothetical protein
MDPMHVTLREKPVDDVRAEPDASQLRARDEAVAPRRQGGDPSNVA